MNVLFIPHVLESVVAHLPVTDCLSLSQTCKYTRSLVIRQLTLDRRVKLSTRKLSDEDSIAFDVFLSKISSLDVVWFSSVKQLFSQWYSLKELYITLEFLKHLESDRKQQIQRMLCLDTLELHLYTRETCGELHTALTYFSQSPLQTLSIYLIKDSVIYCGRGSVRAEDDRATREIVDFGAIRWPSLRYFSFHKRSLFEMMNDDVRGVVVNLIETNKKHLTSLKFTSLGNTWRQFHKPAPGPVSMRLNIPTCPPNLTHLHAPAWLDMRAVVPKIFTQIKSLELFESRLQCSDISAFIFNETLSFQNLHVFKITFIDCLCIWPAEKPGEDKLQGAYLENIRNFCYRCPKLTSLSLRVEGSSHNVHSELCNDKFTEFAEQDLGNVRININ